MATDIKGWVEIKRSNYWFVAVQIDSFLKRNYPLFDFLFGGRSGNYNTAVAARRGFPSDCSIEVKAKYKDIESLRDELEKSPIPFEGTWIGLHEIQMIDWCGKEDLLTEDWRILFQMMQLLASLSHIEDVRLIVDFD